MNCKVCNKKFQDLKDLIKHLVNDHNYTLEDIYKYFDYNFETGEATCPICGSSFIMSKKQLRKHRKGISKGIGCKLSCSATLRCLVGGSPFSTEEVREKAKRTILEKYGEKGILGNSAMREKIKKSNLEKYGVENPMSSQEVRDKAKATLLEKYGVSSPAQSKEILNKMKQTNMERYGVEHAAQSKEILDKMKKTNLEKYGVENASSSEEVKEKRKRTLLERYGVEYASQVPVNKEQVLSKMKQTNLGKYGVEFPAQSKEIQRKTQETNKAKYGVPFSITADEVKDKIFQTNLERYGVENVFQNKEIQKKAQETNIERYGVKYASQSPEILERIRNSNQEKYGVDYFCQHEKCNSENGFRISKVNRRFSELLLENSIENELEFIIDNYGYDLKVGNTLIEIDPYFTHNSTTGPCYGSKRRDPVVSSYHLKKTNLAKEYGYNCIHIFDWDDQDKIVNLLKEKERIFARKCEVKEIDKNIASTFLTKYHIQGSTKQVKFACGLYYKNELVEVMTFGKPRYNKNYEWELLRLCSHSSYQIVGGASKLYNFFEEIINPKSVISYCDLSKFNGEVYETLGFTLVSQTPPTRHWYNPKTKVHITDNLLRQRGFDQLHGTNYGKGTSNEQLMLEHGYVEIYDCGQLVFTKVYDD